MNGKTKEIDNKILNLDTKVDQKLRGRLTATLRTLRLVKDPETTISSLSSVLLHLCRIIYTHCAYEMPEKTLYAFITRLGRGNSSNKIVGLRVLNSEHENWLHKIRLMTNESRHELDPNFSDDSELALERILTVTQWFYCIYPQGPRLDSIYRSSDIVFSENRVAPVLSCEPPFTGTTVFPKIAKQLGFELERSSALITLTGPPGIGKSRIAAALFGMHLPTHLLPVWFESHSAEQLLRNVGEAQRKYPDHKLCIILDEDHSSGRETSFFVEFFASKIWEVIRTTHQVVLVIRSSTYEVLTEQGYLKDSKILHASTSEDFLENSKIWGLNRSLSKEEKRWIRDIAVDQDGNLNSLLIDRICIPHIASGQKMHQGQLGNQKSSILETIYQGLIADQPDIRRKIIEAISLGYQFADFVPLWLITSILTTMGHKMTTKEIENELDYLEWDGLILSQQVEIDQPIYTWRLFHDLVDESIRIRNQRAQNKRRKSIDQGAILESTIHLIRSNAGHNIQTFTEGLAIWIACVTREQEFGVPLAHALFDAAQNLENDTDINTRLYGVICEAVGNLRARPTVDFSKHSVFASACILADILRKIVSLDIIFYHPRTIVALAYQTVRCGIACAALQDHAIWHQPASDIIALHEIGKRLTANITVEDIFEQHTGRLQRDRFFHLLMWAKKWREAGQVIERFIRISSNLQTITKYYEIAQIDTLAFVFLQDGDVQTALNTYKWGTALSDSTSGLKHLSEIYQTNFQILSGWDKKNKGRSDMMLEWPKRINHIHNDPSLVLVISNSPDQGAASLIADRLGECGINCQLLYSEIVPNLSKHLSQKGIVTVGGHLAYGIERLVRPMIRPDKYIKMMMETADEGGRGILTFDMSGCPGVWIGGGTTGGTLKAVLHWIEHRGVQKFITKMK